MHWFVFVLLIAFSEKVIHQYIHRVMLRLYMEPIKDIVHFYVGLLNIVIYYTFFLFSCIEIIKMFNPKLLINLMYVSWISCSLVEKEMGSSSCAVSQAPLAVWVSLQIGLQLCSTASFSRGCLGSSSLPLSPGHLPLLDNNILWISKYKWKLLGLIHVALAECNQMVQFTLRFNFFFFLISNIVKYYNWNIITFLFEYI